MNTSFINDLIQYAVLDIFRTTKCSCSESLYKQLDSILPYIYIISLVTVRFLTVLCSVMILFGIDESDYFLKD
jgi:hypothetical protein